MPALDAGLRRVGARGAEALEAAAGAGYTDVVGGIAARLETDATKR